MSKKWMSTFLTLLTSYFWGANTNPKILLEFRPSYFYPISEDFREIFQDGGIDYQITGAFEAYKGISIWSAVDYFSREGHSTELHEKTTIQIIPLTLGLKYFFPALGQTFPVNFYIASGMKYYFVHTHNSSDLVKKNINVNGMGGSVESGLTTTFKDHFILDFFASYSFKSFGRPHVSNPSIETTGMNVSGINIGAGIGYKF